MENLTKEKINEFITKNKESFYIICANGGLLKNRDCAGFIANSEESARRFFNTIINELPEEMRKFSVMKISNIDDMYSFSGYFNNSSYKYINFIDFGIIEKEYFLKKSKENVEYIYDRIKNFYDNGRIYTIFSKNGNAFCPFEKFTQFFFTNPKDVVEFINRYNTEELGLYSLYFMIDNLMYGLVNDTLNSCFDGRYCSGWDIVEAASIVHNNSFINPKQIKELIGGKTLLILVEVDGSNRIIQQNYNPVFFTSQEKATRFMTDNNTTNKERRFGMVQIERKDVILDLVKNANLVYIDSEKHCTVQDFLSSF